MRTVVTGASGFIGRHLCAGLRARGCPVLGVDVAAADDDVHCCSVLSDRLGPLVASFDPDVVVHLAGQVDVGRSVADPVLDAEMNVVGTIRAYIAARDAGARRFVYPGTWVCYDDTAGKPWRASTTPRAPRSPYGVSKASAVDALRVLAGLGGPSVAVAVLANVYGPGDDSVVTGIARRVLARETPVVTRDVTRDFVHVDDVVEALIAAAAANETAACNVATGKTWSLLRVARLIAEQAGVAAAPQLRDRAPGEVVLVGLDTAEARAAWGFEARIRLPEGVGTVLDALRAEATPSAAAGERP